MCKYTKIIRYNLISTTNHELSLISVLQLTEKKHFTASEQKGSLAITSENTIGYNMNLNLVNITNHTFKLVQFTVELSQNIYT